jgi:4-diphosphocytidyl-2-C-methyl-D-erythritol kinase
MRRLRLRAPAKINWTLEVLGKREDGFHEVRTVLQTIDLCDEIEIAPADDVSLEVRETHPGVAATPVEDNLAYRAAELLRAKTGVSAGTGIVLVKRVPVAAGLGGGSSDAAAVLRGLRLLWQLGIGDEDLGALAAELGSDVPFFLRGGAALATGRGESLAPLPDLPAQRLVVAWPERAPRHDKTRSMYAALDASRYTDGSRSKALAARVRAGERVRDEDMYNVFEGVLARADAEAAEAFERARGLGAGTPHLCGSGPAFFLLLGDGQAAEPLVNELEGLGVRARGARTMTSNEALAVSEVA